MLIIIIGILFFITHYYCFHYCYFFSLLYICCCYTNKTISSIYCEKKYGHSSNALKRTTKTRTLYIQQVHHHYYEYISSSRATSVLIYIATTTYIQFSSCTASRVREQLTLIQTRTIAWRQLSRICRLLTPRAITLSLTTHYDSKSK